MAQAIVALKRLRLKLSELVIDNIYCSGTKFHPEDALLRLRNVAEDETILEDTFYTLKIFKRRWPCAQSTEEEKLRARKERKQVFVSC